MSTQSPADIMARLNKGAALQEEKQTAKKTQTAQTVDTKTFEITEADIKSNPVYSIITDKKLTDQKKLDALAELKRYNPALTEEQNELNREASNEFLLYVENQLMAAAQKGIEFTNDDAFSLYDETVQELFGNIKIFKGYIEPFVKALEVLQKAREADMPANELIEAVSGMQTDIAQMQSDKEAKELKVIDLTTERDKFNDTATYTANRLEELSAQMNAATSAKADAEKSWNLISRGKAIEKAQDEITHINRQIDTLSNTAKVTAEDLERKNLSIAALDQEISDLGTKITELEESLASNDDLSAIATLIEITGADFKDKREEVVVSAQSITEKAIAGIEKSISRFKSGEAETGTQLNAVMNLNGMVGLLSTADKEVRKIDAAFITEQQEIVNRIKEEKGDKAVYDPDYEIAKKHLDAANEHVTDVISSAGRASDLEGKLTRQTGTFRSLRDAYVQKGEDSTKLRTSAAVEIPSQLAITVKSVEMATASESNNMVNDAFADLSSTTQKSVKSIFETVSAGAGKNNEQLRRALESTMSTIDLMNDVEADMKAKAKEGYEVRESLTRAQQALKDVTETAASARVDAEHEEMVKKVPANDLDPVSEAPKAAPRAPGLG